MLAKLLSENSGKYIVLVMTNYAKLSWHNDLSNPTEEYLQKKNICSYPETVLRNRQMF